MPFRSTVEASVIVLAFALVVGCIIFVLLLVLVGGRHLWHLFVGGFPIVLIPLVILVAVIPDAS